MLNILFVMNSLKKRILFKINLPVFVLFLLWVLFNQQLSAQNERFHGGSGDGADVCTSASIDFNSVDYEGDVFTGYIDLAAGQADTTDIKTINFKLSLSEPAHDLTSSSIKLSGDAQPQKVVITGSGTEYNMAVSGMLNNGSVMVELPAGSVHNSVGAPNLSAVIIENEVIFVGADFTVEINRATGQEYITNTDTAYFSVNFNEFVIDFNEADIELSGTATPTSMVVVGDGKTFDVAVSGYQNEGTIVINILADKVKSTYGKFNEASINTGNIVVFDNSRPDVEIKLNEGQQNPAYTFPIKFKVIFSEEVIDFSDGSVTYGGSPGLKIIVSGNGSVYTVSVDSAITSETISIYIDENAVHDYAGNGNTIAQNTANSVTFKGTTGINDLKIDDFAKIYSQNGKLSILLKKIPEHKVFAEIYQLSGQRIVNRYLLNMINTIELKPFNTYILRLSGRNFLFSKKVFVQ